jgi:2-keto-4-pentenoate hydratase
MRAQLAKRAAALAAGEGALGWKVGFGSPTALERLAIAAPLVGFLTRRALVTSGAIVAVGGWTKPVAEPEVALHLARDVEPGSTLEAVAAAISGVGPAIELADVDREPDDVEAILAGNIYQRAVAFGPKDLSRAGGATEGLEARVYRNGQAEARTTEIEALTGELVPLVRHVADLVAAFGEKLRAGDVVIAGSVVPPLTVRPPEEIRFELDPVGNVAVRVVSEPHA